MTRPTLAAHLDPSDSPSVVDLRNRDEGLGYSEAIDLATELGLKETPPISPSPEVVLHWLQVYGPLWTPGRDHVVVIAGIDLAAQHFLVYDPAPKLVGRIGWRPYSWYFTGRYHSSRSTNVRVAFLHHP